MACTFKIPFTGDAQQILNKARTAVEGQGGTFTGNEMAGNFEVSVMGTIQGSYNVMDNELEIDITSKPMFVGCGMIENFLKSKLGG